MNLIIGNTSQLSFYFPPEYQRISSRNINDKDLLDKYDNVFITFAEQRTFDKSLTENDFLEVNVLYTSKIVDLVKDRSKKVFLYGTSELWNNCNGLINIETPINYRYSPYVKSKEVLWNLIKENREKSEWDNVNIIHPFNFNSIHRKSGFLFYKFYDSIINKTINHVGNININRDIIHPSYLVRKSINCDSDILVGSGKTTNIKNFIEQIFNYYGLNMTDYIKENIESNSNHQSNTFWLETENIYDDLMNDTIKELNKILK
jgi:nucleoside-diphosphate-sugar epimerase